MTSKFRERKMQRIQRRAERHWVNLMDLQYDLMDAAELCEDGKDAETALYLAHECEKLVNLIGRTYGW